MAREAREGAPALFEVGSLAAPILPGATGSGTLRLEGLGKYYYACLLPGHVALGMWGELLVEG